MRTKLRPESNSAIEQGHPLFKQSKFRYLPLIILSVLLLNLLVTCNSYRRLQVVSENQPYIYVQNPADGTTVQAKPAEPLYRSDAVITKFTEDWLKLAFTWKVPPEKGKAFVNERGIDFPYQFHVASLAILPGYRERYMDMTAQKYQKEFPFANYISGQFQSYVRIYEPGQSKVQLVEKGIWDVTIVATRTHASNMSILAQEIFNRVIRVRAIHPSSSDQKLWGDRDTQLGRLLNEMQRQGLQIIQINEF